MNRKSVVLVALLLCFVAASVFAADTAAPAADAGSTSAVKYIAASLAVGLACIAGGMAVGKIGAAAMGAMSENAELSGKSRTKMYFPMHYSLRLQLTSSNIVRHSRRK